MYRTVNTISLVLLLFAVDFAIGAGTGHVIITLLNLPSDIAIFLALVLGVAIFALAMQANVWAIKKIARYSQWS